MKTAIFCVLVLLSSSAFADEFYLHLFSEHAGNKAHLNEDNYGIGWRDDGQIAATAGPSTFWALPATRTRQRSTTDT